MSWWLSPKSSPRAYHLSSVWPRDRAYSKLQTLLSFSLPTIETWNREKASYRQELLGQGFIRPITPPEAARVLFASKKDGKLRFYIDCRVLNKHTGFDNLLYHWFMVCVPSKSRKCQILKTAFITPFSLSSPLLSRAWWAPCFESSALSLFTLMTCLSSLRPVQNTRSTWIRFPKSSKTNTFMSTAPSVSSFKNASNSWGMSWPQCCQPVSF